MKNPRVPVMIMVVSLVAVAVLTLRAFIQPYSAKENSALYTGRGDYQRFENQLAIPKTGSQSNSPQYTGRGDYQRFESQSARITGFADLNRVTMSRPRITGFADLNRIESTGKAAAIAAASNQAASQNGRITGFADLNRLPAAVLPQTGGNPAQSQNRVCPHQSSPAGERDAGASAPAYVLQAMGCQTAGE